MEIVVTGLWPVGQLLARSLGSQIFDLHHRMNFPCGRSPQMMITFGSRVISQMDSAPFRKVERAAAQFLHQRLPVIRSHLHLAPASRRSDHGAPPDAARK
jgi:hypothetical protein